jgi:hypothetical protein
MTISAAFTIEGAANPAAHTVAYGATVDLAIVSASGLDSVAFSIIGVSKSDQAIPALTEAGSPIGSTATFTMPADPSDGLGRSFLIQCFVRSGRETAVSYGIVGAVNGNGVLPLAAGEELARGAYGYIDELNQALAPNALITALPAASISAAGYTVLTKTTTGTGAVNGLTLGTNQFLCRASGNVINVAVADGEIVGRVGGDMGAFAANSFEFVNTTANGGNPTLKVAPAATAQVSGLATAANANYDATLTQLGYYQFTVCAIVKMTTANTYHRVSAVIDAVRTGPTTLTIMGTQVDLPGGDDTGLTLTLSATSGNIRANLANATGETVDGYVHFGWIRSDEIA